MCHLIDDVVEKQFSRKFYFICFVKILIIILVAKSSFANWNCWSCGFYAWLNYNSLKFPRVFINDDSLLVGL